MKYLLTLVLLFATGVISRADSFVSVTTEPTVYSLFGGAGGCCVNETIGVTFTWDVTTNGLSNFMVMQTGPLPTFTEAFVSFGPAYINYLAFGDGQGDTFSVFREAPGRNNIGSAPGTYENIGLDLYCGQFARCLEGDNINIGTAVVTSLGDGDHDSDDPVATPEPGSLILLGLGIAVLAFAFCKPISEFHVLIKLPRQNYSH